MYALSAALAGVTVNAPAASPTVMAAAAARILRATRLRGGGY